MDFASVIGLIGVGFILYAYFLLQTRKINPKGISYSLVNLVGSILVLFSLFYHWNTPSVVIEIAWISISLYGLSRAIKLKI